MKEKFKIIKWVFTRKWESKVFFKYVLFCSYVRVCHFKFKSQSSASHRKLKRINIAWETQTRTKEITRNRRCIKHEILNFFPKYKTVRWRKKAAANSFCLKFGQNFENIIWKVENKKPYSNGRTNLKGGKFGPRQLHKQWCKSEKNEIFLWEYWTAVPVVKDERHTMSTCLCIWRWVFALKNRSNDLYQRKVRVWVYRDGIDRLKRLFK